MTAALLLPLISSACSHTGPAPVEVHLPPPELIVPAPAPRPAVKAGEDARLVAARAFSYGDLNAERLLQATEAYRSLRDAARAPAGSQ